MGKADYIDEYEAAVEYGFSPELLRWLTQYPVVDKATLSFKEEDGVYYFSHKSLRSLDKKMSGAWPLPPKGTRPTIPGGIEREIKEEAQFSCPVCHRTQGELAHIRAVSKTYCNHPKNLIYLCPNHHGEYDFGNIYKNVSLEDVKAYKESLRRFRRHQWAIKGEIIRTYLGALNAAVSLLEIHEVVSKCIDDEKFDTVLRSVAESIEAQKGTGGVELNIEKLKDEIKDYTSSHSDSLCPLCKGLGGTSFYTPCPICLGNGEVELDDDRLERLSYYELVDCYLCEGTGRKDGDTCPACEGERQVPRGWAENHDWSRYELVDCYLCEGTGRKDGDTCPACEGECQVPRGWAENHDWSRYEA